VIEEADPPEITMGEGRTSEELAQEIAVAPKEEKPNAEDTVQHPTFSAPEDVEPPVPTEAAPETDTAGEKTATQRLMEKKGYQSPENIAEAYEDLEKYLGKRDGYVPQETPPEPQPIPAPPAKTPENFDWFWQRMAENPVQTLDEAIENANFRIGQKYQNQFQEATKRRLAFEAVAEKKLPYWKDINVDYNRNLQLGMNFDEAFERAELNHLRDRYKSGYSKGLEDVETKKIQAANAEIEGSEASPPKEDKEITPDEFRRLSLSDMEKLLPHKY
jgi:hypothetical protein